MLSFGIGPLDSVMNALEVVRHYDRYLNGLGELPEVLPRPTIRRWRRRRA